MYDFSKHTDAQLEERAAAIMNEMDNEGADLDSLAAEAAAIRNERLKSLLQENQDLLDRYPEIVTREIKNPLRILRRYAHAR